MSVSTAKAPSSDGEFEVIDTKKLSSGMRNRKKSQAELLVEGTIDGAAKLVPEDYKPYVEMLKPAVEPVFNIIHMLIPYVFMIGSLLKDLWEKNVECLATKINDWHCLRRFNPVIQSRCYWN